MSLLFIFRIFYSFKKKTSYNSKKKFIMPDTTHPFLLALFQELQNKSIEVTTSTINHYTIFSFQNPNGYYVKIYTRKSYSLPIEPPLYTLPTPNLLEQDNIAYFTKNMKLSSTPLPDDQIYVCSRKVSKFIENCLE